MAIKSPRTAMIVAIVIIAVTFLVVVGVMLAYWPKGISVNENDEIQLSTYIGKPQLFPSIVIWILSSFVRPYCLNTLSHRRSLW